MDIPGVRLCENDAYQAGLNKLFQLTQENFIFGVAVHPWASTVLSAVSVSATRAPSTLIKLGTLLTPCSTSGRILLEGKLAVILDAMVSKTQRCKVTITSSFCVICDIVAENGTQVQIGRTRLCQGVQVLEKEDLQV